MAKLYIGRDRIRKNYMGTSRIKKIYIGRDLVFSDSHVVTYHINTDNVVQIEVDDGENALVSPWVPTAAISGWTFVGWREDSSANPSVISSKTVLIDGIHLYAVFKQDIALYYNGNGASSGSTAAQSDTRYYNNGNVVNPTFTVRSNGFARTDFRFDYWNVGSTSGTAIGAGQPITLSQSTTLYAHWTQTVWRLIDGNYYMDATSYPFLVFGFKVTDYPNKTITIAVDYVSGDYYEYSARVGRKVEWVMGIDNINGYGYPGWPEAAVYRASATYVQTGTLDTAFFQPLGGYLNNSVSISTNNWNASYPYVALVSPWVGYGTTAPKGLATGTFRVRITIS